MKARLPASALAGIAAAAATGWWYLTAPGRSVGTGVADLAAMLTGTIRLSEAQRAMVELISDQFNQGGFGWLGPAAVANAYAESRLDPMAAGDNGASIGLFQLHERGAGAGLTVEQRQNPVVNCARILEVVRGPQGTAVRAARGTATNAELASLFAHYIERCSACGYQDGDSQLRYRADLVSKLFGAEVARSVPR